MRFILFLTVIVIISTYFKVYASDWVEDSQSSPVRINDNKQPLTADPNGNNAQLVPSSKQTFSINPQNQNNYSVDTNPLEAKVSKWGTNETLNNPSDQTIPFIRRGFFSQIVKTKMVPPAIFRAWLEKVHPQFALSTSTADPLRVLEVKGQWDDADHTLHSFQIRHTTIKKSKLISIPFDDVRVLVINCAGVVPHESLQRMRDFVASGGFLISTDWTVHNLLEKAFPGYIAWNGGKTGNEVVDAHLVGINPILFAGCVNNATWKLDDGSQTIRILHPAVKVLAYSRLLVRDDPDRKGILAVIFPFGRGYVLHLVGHFDNNATLAFDNLLPDPAPVMGISLRQGLAVNFLIAGCCRTYNLP